MMTTRILAGSIVTLLGFSPLGAHAAEDVFQTGTNWLVPGNWSLNALPGPADNVRITTTGTLSITGPATVEVQDLNVAGTTATTLLNADNATESLLILNGGRGAGVPLIQSGAAQFTLGMEFSSSLDVQLKTSGAFQVGPGGLVINSTIAESGGAHGVIKTGPGTLTFGPSGNLYTGPTTVAEGTLILAGLGESTNIPGDLIVENGGAVRFAGNGVDRIADTATMILNGGTFGDPTNVSPTTLGLIEVVKNVLVNGGTLATGRNLPPAREPFTVTDLLRISSGLVLAQRAGGLNAGRVEISGGSLNLDGGSTTMSAESRLNVGAGGLALNGGTINFNAGPSPVTATSNGSIVALGGDLTSTGTINLVRHNATVVGPKAVIDLRGEERVFNVAGALNLGTIAAPIALTNGALRKAGSGTLTLPGVNDYSGTTNIDAGTLVLTGTLASSNRIEVGAGATFDVAGVAGTFTLGPAQTLAGDGTVAGHVIANGTVAPGVGIGTLAFAERLTLAGTANFEINKNFSTLSADLADVAAALTYGGTLNAVASGDALTAGDTFDLFNAASFNGNFAVINLPPLTAGLSWSTTNLSVDGTIAVVPEPGAAASLVSGAAMLLGLLRIRWRG